MILKPIPGFSNQIEKKADRIIAVYGLPGAGKTRFCATAPGPIGMIPLDGKTRFTISKTMAEWGRDDIYWPEKDFIRHQNPIAAATMTPDQAKKYYGGYMAQMMELAYRLAESKDIATICIDSASSLWNAILFHHYGRLNQIQPFQRQPANQDFIDMIHHLSSKNLILTQQATESWAGSGSDAKPTGRYKPSGFPHLGFHVTALVEMRKNTAWNESNGGSPGKPWKWSLSIVECQNMPVLEGPMGIDALADDGITWDSLMALLYPE